ncbi:MAG: NAD(P)-binding domain-containing protein [Treponema sp.]|jgi:pyrroline-5-carboxylate reductase|nr:NAD(P)-binding domain-containing protein [Treponema sp.]
MEKKIGIIGYGSMGKMIFYKFIEAKVIPENNIFLSNRTYDKIIDLKTIFPKLNIYKSNRDVAKNANILFICVKPFEIKYVLTEIIAEVNDDCHIVSLNGSVLFEQIEKICKNRKISKVIPSVTAEINQSVTLICHNKYVKNSDKNTLNLLLESFGTIAEIPEAEIGMGSELTSCMPGFIGAIFKVITDEAEKHTSIDKNEIIKMVVETLCGTGKLLLEKEMTFEQLINRVATKGGITEEGTKVIDAKMPEIINELFEKTLEKRKITAEKVQKDFDL